jgi:protein-L-isoaspartate(D-aspartate) O-methyltransferase
MTRWLSAFYMGADVPSEPAPGEHPFTAERERMVAEQLSGAGRAISDPLVLQAMSKVPRHEFVPEFLRSRAYDDTPLAIGHGQTISQPYVVALMTEQLHLSSEARVLEIGTGSGYQTAVLAELVQQVYSIEIIAQLAQRAAEVLARLGYRNVAVREDDGHQGWPEAAPFDAVIVTCAPERIPEPLVEQLRDGGQMMIPVGRTPHQELILLTKHGAELRQQSVLPVRFVPMTGESESRP